MSDRNEVGFSIGNQGKGGLLFSKNDGDGNIKALHLTNEQMDKVIEAGASALPDAMSAIKGIIDIARIQTQANARVMEVEAETDKIVRATRVEIDRLRQSGERIRSRGEVVTRIITEMTKALDPAELDAQSRLVFIQFMKDILFKTLEEN